MYLKYGVIIFYQSMFQPIYAECHGRTIKIHLFEKNIKFTGAWEIDSPNLLGSECVYIRLCADRAAFQNTHAHTQKHT